MRIASAIPILTFVGFMNFECAASQDVIVVQMSDRVWFHGQFHSGRPVPDWMSPRINPEIFPGYEIFIRFWAHHEYLYRSDLLTPKGQVPHNRIAALHPPSQVKLWLGEKLYANKEPFVPYNSTITPVWNCDRLFITIPGTTLVYQTVLKVGVNLEPFESPLRGMKRPRVE